MASVLSHGTRIDVSIESMARPVAVDHRISIHYYFRIADNLLLQANVYREEKNVLDLYIILLRYSSLLLETIPKHRDYHAFKAREKEFLKKGPHNSEKILLVVNELESLKPVVQQQIATCNSRGADEPDGVYGTYAASGGLEHHTSGPYMSKSLAGNPTRLLQKPLPGSKHEAATSQSIQPYRHAMKPPTNMLYAKEETLSRHSILGPNSIQGNLGQWTSPVTGIRIEYPHNPELTQSDISSLMPTILKQDDLRGASTASQDKKFSQLNIRQPSLPPVLAQVHSEHGPIPSSRVADPRPGLPTSETGRYQNLHVPVALMECFLRVAELNTAKNLETCGILAGTLKKRTFYVTTLIIPKQKSTSDSCQATNEEEIFEVQDKGSLLSLGWIHTHPTQTCFLSSIDLHNHYAYQIMLPEAIAIVMAPTDTTRKHGIFHLTEPCGMGVIHDCDATGFHPHEEPLDGTPIYEHCSHVYMNPNVKFEMIDLREA